MSARPASESQGALLLGAAAIITVAICLGLLANHVSARSLPLFASEESLRPDVPSGVAYMGLSEARARLDEAGVIFLDARSPAEFASGHLRGAVNLPVADFQSASRPLQARLHLATLLICYCDSMTCDDGAQLCGLLSAAGYRQVVLMFEGWEGWQQAGYPVSTGEAAGR